MPETKVTRAPYAKVKAKPAPRSTAKGHGKAKTKPPAAAPRRPAGKRRR